MPNLPARTHAFPKPASQFHREKTAARGYDVSHRRMRALCFERDQFRCIDCGWEPEIVRVFRSAGLGLPSVVQVMESLRHAFARGEVHLHADHVIPVEQREDLRLVLENLATRCNRCHSKKTAGEDGGFGRIARKPQENRPFSAGNRHESAGVGAVTVAASPVAS